LKQKKKNTLKNSRDSGNDERLVFFFRISFTFDIRTRTKLNTFALFFLCLMSNLI